MISDFAYLVQYLLVTKEPFINETVLHGIISIHNNYITIYYSINFITKKAHNHDVFSLDMFKMNRWSSIDLWLWVINNYFFVIILVNLKVYSLFHSLMGHEVNLRVELSTEVLNQVQCFPYCFHGIFHGSGIAFSILLSY